eukprot:2177921-Pleurochrysis_carterae.AAC.1
MEAADIVSPIDSGVIPRDTVRRAQVPLLKPAHVVSVAPVSSHVAVALVKSERWRRRAENGEPIHRKADQLVGRRVVVANPRVVVVREREPS